MQSDIHLHTRGPGTTTYAIHIFVIHILYVILYVQATRYPRTFYTIVLSSIFNYDVKNIEKGRD